MTDTTPGADERRIRALLVTRGVGPDAAPPKPTTRRRDWLDDILDTPPAAKPETKKPAAKPAATPPPAKRPGVEPPKAKKAKRGTRKTPDPKTAPAFRERAAHATQKAATAVTDRIPGTHRINKKHAAYTAYWITAATAGWSIGLEPWFADCLDYYVGNGPSGAVTLAILAVIVLVIDGRTHNLRGPGRHPFARLIGWTCRIPLASAALAIALYNTR